MSSSQSKAYGVVTQMYTFTAPWPNQKGFSSGARRSSMTYVGFPGLSLTPIQESPLLDSVLADELRHEHRHLRHSRTYAGGNEHDCWLQHDDHPHEEWDNKGWNRTDSLPAHWLASKLGNDAKKDVDVESGELLKKEKNGIIASQNFSKTPTPVSSKSSLVPSPSKECAVSVQVVQTSTFFPKDDPMSQQQRRTYVCKLLLFAFVGFLVIAGIVLWIFSPAFT